MNDPPSPAEPQRAPAGAPNRRLARFGDELYDAWRRREVVEPLRIRAPDLGVEDAYRIAQRVLARRLREGERISGKKIGVTSEAVQKMLGVDQPDFGLLTDAMAVPDGGAVRIATSLIQPRAEAEIALILAHDLQGPGVTPADVLAACAAVAPCFEIVDSRIRDWNIGIVDTVADNASCGLYVLGAGRGDPRELDLAALRCVVRKNGVQISEGFGSAVQGSPLASVAWLANTLGPLGERLRAGEVILSGSLVPLEPAAAGDRFDMYIDGLGSASVNFV